MPERDGVSAGVGKETNERGVWELPASAFDSERGTRRNRIVELRRGTQLSIEEMAARVGVPVRTLALWENNVLPSGEEWLAVERIAEMFGCSTAFLLGTDILDDEDGD